MPGHRGGGVSASTMTMIRAIIEDGQIGPLAPLPAEWIEGRRVIVEDAGSAPPDDLEEWYRELQELGLAQYEPGEWERVQATLAEADELAKAAVRREMGLP
jgi:hypothetical protein